MAGSPPTMSEEHDKSHRLLFSHPAMIIDLIRRFVGGTVLIPTMEPGATIHRDQL